MVQKCSNRRKTMLHFFLTADLRRDLVQGFGSDFVRGGGQRNASDFVFF
jgi:hypothetical protein